MRLVRPLAGIFLLAAAWYLATAASETALCVNRRKHSVFPRADGIWASCIENHWNFPSSFFR